MLGSRIKSVALVAPAWIVAMALACMAVVLQFPVLAETQAGMGSAVLVAVLIACAGIVLTVRTTGRGRPLGGRLGWSLALGMIAVLAARPLGLDQQLTWRIQGGGDHNQRLVTQPSAEAHGVTESNVVQFHASNLGNAADQPWRYRAEADIRSLTLFGPTVFWFKVSQPDWARVDPATGLPRPQADGVEGRFLARIADRWHVLSVVPIEPSSKAWQAVRVEAPWKARRLAIEWFARKNMESDAVFTAMLPSQSRVLGLPLNLPRFLGESILAGLFLFGLSLLLDAVARLASRVGVIAAAETPPPRKIPRWASAAGIVILAALPLPLVIAMAPWLDTATTPVVVDLAAPADCNIDVRFGEGARDLVRAVRISDDKWAAELPPRKPYRVAIVFQSDVKDLVLGRISMIDTTAVTWPPPSTFRTIDPIDLRPTGGDIDRVTMTDGRLRVTARAGTELRLAEEVFPLKSNHTTFGIWAACAGALVIAAIGMTLLLRRGNSGLIPRAQSPSLRPLVITAILIAVFGIVWSLGTPTLVMGDTPSYLGKAVSIADRGVYDTGKQQGEITRLPGYPVFLAVVFKLAGKNVNAVPVAHAIILAFGLFTFSASLRPFIPAPPLIVGMLLAAISPVQLHYVRSLLAEVPFVAFSLIALGCWFFSINAHGGRRLHWLVAYGVAATVAVFHRPIGLCIVTPVFLMWAPKVWELWRSRHGLTRRLANIVRFSIPLAVPVVIVGVAVLGWSYRNKVKTGYFGLSDMGGLSILHGHLTTGALDPRVFELQGVYDSYVTARLRQAYAWSTFEIRSDLFERERQAGTGRKDMLTHVADRYDAMAKADDAAIPWANRCVRYLRTAWFLLRPVEMRDYIGAWKWHACHWWFIDDVPDPEREAKLKLASTGHSFGTTDVRKGPFVDGIIEVTGPPSFPAYARFQFVLFILGLVASLWLLHRGTAALASLFGFVLTTFLLLMAMLQHDARYMDIMDVFMIFQLLIAVGLGRNRGAHPAAAPGGATAVTS